MPDHDLQGLPLTRANLTVLVVEDSRHASDALRLMLARIGARMRRAASLADARRYLTHLRPDALIVDLGLPDGKGEALLASLALNPHRPARLVAISGSPERRRSALACGADVFLEKPVAGIAALGAAVMPGLILPDSTAPSMPDPLALADDLALAAERLRHEPTPQERRYIAGFLSGLARQSGDPALQAAAEGLPKGADPSPVLRLIGDRRAALPRL